MGIGAGMLAVIMHDGNLELEARELLCRQRNARSRSDIDARRWYKSDMLALVENRGMSERRGGKADRRDRLYLRNLATNRGGLGPAPEVGNCMLFDAI